MSKKQKNVLWRIIASAVLIVCLTVIGKFITLNKYIWLVLNLIPYFIIGYDILKKAVKGIFKGQVFDENFLMAVATVGAIALGDYKEGVAVMLFYQIGELFQSIAVGKSRRNISALMDIRPDYANVEVDGKLEKVDPDEVAVGTEITVNPGEKIPIDGIVTSGDTSLNTSALTGESLPRNIKTGDEVISGCINMTGVIKVKTTKEFGDSTVSKILDLVENSSMKKILYSGGLLFGTCTRNFASGYKAYCRSHGHVERLDIQSAYLPCHQLSVRSCNIGSALVFCGYRLCFGERYTCKRLQLS